MIEICTMPVGAFQCNCSVIGCSETGEAIIVDPGEEGPKIVAAVRERGYRVKYLLHTHAHLDHIGATAEVKKEVGGDVVLHRDDLFLYDQAHLQAMMMGLPAVTEPPPVDHYLEDEEHFHLGNDHLQALFTPGHTPGSASFLIQTGSEQILFAGDTLFRRSIGRTDLPGGDFDTITKSIKNRLFTLDGDTRVVPGHGPLSTIGEERCENPFVGNSA